MTTAATISPLDWSARSARLAKLRRAARRRARQIQNLYWAAAYWDRADDSVLLEVAVAWSERIENLWLQFVGQAALPEGVKTAELHLEVLDNSKPGWFVLRLVRRGYRDAQKLFPVDLADLIFRVHKVSMGWCEGGIKLWDDDEKPEDEPPVLNPRWLARFCRYSNGCVVRLAGMPIVVKGIYHAGHMHWAGMSRPQEETPSEQGEKESCDDIEMTECESDPGWRDASAPREPEPGPTVAPAETTSSDDTVHGTNSPCTLPCSSPIHSSSGDHPIVRDDPVDPPPCTDSHLPVDDEDLDDLLRADPDHIDDMGTTLSNPHIPEESKITKSEMRQEEFLQGMEKK